MSLKRGVIMSQEISEIGKILEKHPYSMTSVLMETAQTFQLRSIVQNAGFEKPQGYRVVEMMTWMMLLPFLLVKSVHSLFVSDFKRITEMKKDTIYRLKNHELVPWRSIRYGVVKRFQTLTHPKKPSRRIQRLWSTIRQTPGSDLKSKRSPSGTIMWPAKKDRS